MIESVGMAVEKVVEKVATFFDKLESTVEVAKPEVEKQGELVKAYWESLEADDVVPTQATAIEKTGLTEEQKALIIKETGWPAEITDCIESMEQYEIYKEAGLEAVEIDGRPCLVKDIDMDYIDTKTGLTNRELMKKGRSPIDAKTGEKIELHHMGQGFDSPFAELCENSEHGDGKDIILHDKKIESWRQDAEQKNQYNNVQRPNHWVARSKEA